MQSAWLGEGRQDYCRATHKVFPDPPLKLVLKLRTAYLAWISLFSIHFEESDPPKGTTYEPQRKWLA